MAILKVKTFSIDFLKVVPTIKGNEDWVLRIFVADILDIAKGLHASDFGIFPKSSMCYHILLLDFVLSLI